MRAALCLLTVIALSATARAEKSNQVRPTPSPITDPGLGAGDLIFAPQVIFARYTDSLETGIPGVSQEYDIRSAGVVLGAKYALRDWLAFDLAVEVYRKFGTITGPSPGAPSKLVETHALGWAVKGGGQVNARLYRRGVADTGDEPTLGDFSVYLFAKGLVDVFRQDQKEPFYQSEIAENGFDYRAGAATHVYLGGGIFVAPFVGVEGVVFSSQIRSRTAAGAETIDETSGSERPAPFFGADILWAPAILGSGYDQAISLAAIYALTAEDDTGFGGSILTLSVGYSLNF